jgi:hypothetical protein
MIVPRCSGPIGTWISPFESVIGFIDSAALPTKTTGVWSLTGLPVLPFSTRIVISFASASGAMGCCATHSAEHESKAEANENRINALFLASDD